MNDTYEILVEGVIASDDCAYPEGSCGIGRLKSAGKGIPVGTLALIEAQGVTGEVELTIPAEHCIFVPPGISRDHAYLVPAFVFSLWAWEKLALELGEVALFTGSNLISRMLGQVALWRCACPVISLDPIGLQNAGIRCAKVGIDERDEVSGWVRRQINGKSGFAAIDMDGRASIVDLLLEIMPRWGRLMFASDKTQSLTIDYYNNIHRKGGQIISTKFKPTMIFNRYKYPLIDDHVRRAFRILSNEKMCRDLQIAIGDLQSMASAANRLVKRPVG